MKNFIFAIATLLTTAPAVAAPGGVGELVGKYKLQQNLFGTCYPEIEAEAEDFLGNPGLGIYGARGTGQIVYQFQFVNKGYHSVPQTNPMTGETIGLMNSLSVIGGGKLEGFTEVTNATGAVAYRREIKGAFAGGSLQFEVREARGTSARAQALKAGCVYTKGN